MEENKVQGYTCLKCGTLMLNQSLTGYCSVECYNKNFIDSTKKVVLTEITINTNSMVRVTLTREGEDILQRYYINAGINMFRLSESKYKKEKEFQLWDLMHIFGSHFWLGNKVPFVNNEIKIVNEEVEG